MESETKQEVKQTNEHKNFKFMGVEFPFYFKNPRWVHNNQGAVTIAFDQNDWTAAQKDQFTTKYQKELQILVIKVLEKQLKVEISAL